MSKLEQLEKMRKEIAFHSLLYYDLNTSIISDSEYDNLVFELAKLSEEADYEGIDGWHFDEFMDFWCDDTRYTSGFSLKCRYEEEIIERAVKAFEDGKLDISKETFESHIKWIRKKEENYAS